MDETSALPLSMPARLPMPRSDSAKLFAAEENSVPAQPEDERSSAAELAPPKKDTSAPPSSSYHEIGAAASDGGCGKHNQPSPAFASFFGSRSSSQAAGTTTSQQPRSLKNHDVLHHHDRLKVEPFSPSEDSSSSEIRKRNIPSIISTQLGGSLLSVSPMLGGASPGKSPNKKRSMEGRSELSTHSEDEQPHTPKYRCLLRDLSLNSPARSSASNTPEEAGGSVQQSPYRRPPNIPSFIKKKRESILPTDSYSYESQSFSAGNTPIRTPETGQFYARPAEKISTPTTASSSFLSMRSNRTSIGHQNSPFKMLPPRLGDQSQGSNDPPELIHSSYSPFVSSPTRFASSPTRFASSSPYASPSPRVVPLKILSRDGSPVEHAKLASAAGDVPKLGMDYLPYDPSTSSQAVMSSPLMRSLDQFAKKDSMEQMNDEDGEEEKLSGAAMPSLLGKSSKSHSDYPQLPRIKLTPRSKSNYASLMLDASPLGEAKPPRLNLLASSSGRPLRMRTENSGDQEDAEMDSLLSGFGHHNNANDDEPLNGKQLKRDYSLDRVESEESEMVAIARTPLLLPSFCAQAKDQKAAPVETKPMKSITFKTPEHDRDRLGSPSFLPRFVPSTKSRSLFNSPRVDDPVEQIIRADAIAEAAKSNEELTDDESDSEEPGSDFLLCSPKAYASEMLHKMEKRPTKALPVKPSYRAESPSFGRSRASSIGSLKKKTRSFSSPTTPTIAEEGLASFDATFSKSTTTNECTHQGFGHRDRSAATLSSSCSLSDCDDATLNHCHSHTMPTSIDVGIKNIGLSMTSLCGLDIVDESVEFRDKVPASLPSESSQIPKQAEGVVGLRRSDFSQNSLGLSVDSVGDAEHRDLFTPPLMATRNMQSPPPLPRRSVNYQFF